MFNIRSIAIFLSFFTIVYLLSYLRYSNGFSTIADLGLVSNNYYRFVDGDYSVFFEGHVKIINYFVFSLTKIFNPSSPSIYFLFIQSLFIALPIFIINKKYNFLSVLIYISGVFIWYISYFDYHSDIFIIILLSIFFYFFDQKKYKSAFIVSLSFLLVKEIYFICLFSASLLFLSDKKYFYFIFSIFFSIVYAYLTIWIFIPFFSEINLETERNSFFYFDISIRELGYLFIIFLSYLFVPIFNIKKIIFIIPFLIIYIFARETNYASINAHYNAVLLIPLLFSLLDFYKNNKLILKIVIGLNLIINSFIGVSPISYFFYTDKYWQYGLNTFQKDIDFLNLIKFIKLNYNNDINIHISVSNTINNDYINSFKYLSIFPDGLNKDRTFKRVSNFPKLLDLYIFSNDPKLIILRVKEPYFIKDRLCIDNCFSKTMKFIDNKYKLIYQNYKYRVYSYE